MASRNSGSSASSDLRGEGLTLEQLRNLSEDDLKKMKIVMEILKMSDEVKRGGSFVQVNIGGVHLGNN